ncbi:MAG: hypothetical protein JWQ63_1940 [Mucilaginibacter sp.]|jgi:hypothetical protein|nr:hypothetical protein [Mucilaginibacter sp.]
MFSRKQIHAQTANSPINSLSNQLLSNNNLSTTNINIFFNLQTKLEISYK